MHAGRSLGQLRALVLAAARGENGGDLGPAARCFLRRREKEGGKGPLAEQGLYRVLLFLATRAAASLAGAASVGRPAGGALGGSGHHGARRARGVSSSGCGCASGGGGGGELGTVVGACRAGAGAGAGVASASASDGCKCCQDRCGAVTGEEAGTGAESATAAPHRWPLKGGFDRAFARACEALDAEERRLLRPGDLGPRDLALASRSVFGHLH